MATYLLKRLIIATITLVLASMVVFAVMEILPGDPARLMLGFNASADQVELLRNQMGLNAPLVLRYLHWAGGLLSLDFGRSYTYSVPVIDLVGERVVVSLPLALIALALPQAAILARVARSALIEVLNEDYIRTARAKGLPYRAVLWRHALRNAMIPVLTILGLQFAFLLAGTIIIENVFYLPGLGRLVFQAITQRDLIVVESVVMLLVAAVIAVNLLVDFSYAVVDPRLRGRQ
ncbi:MAG: ABC transporter permease [Mesorhizobium sp.]|uniref:ABC transporter permease n=1 Tax=Mesorhizobium sp. TaxID=1871066 RepID=UPI000FE6A8F4|nr:ABC transporter permease [Mesorhizobium sp.]RWG39591.1 MAG: ABC transporter permease [Mesorhizobium sp.]